MKQPQRGGLLFYSCAPSDDILCEQLARTLRPLVREAHLSEGAAHQILPGTDILHARQQAWEDATLILLLLSPDSLASDTCYQEMLNALERQQRGLGEVVQVPFPEFDAGEKRLLLRVYVGLCSLPAPVCEKM